MSHKCCALFERHHFSNLWEVDQTAYMEAWKKYHKIARTNPPEDKHLDVRNMSKTL